MKAIVNVPVCPMLESPCFHCSTVDEVLYGMAVDILEEPESGWYRIRTHYRYEGFVPAGALLLDEEAVARWLALPRQVVYHKNCCDVLSAPKVQGWHVQELVRGCLVAPSGQPENGWQRVLLADGSEGYVQASILAPHLTGPAGGEEDLRRAVVAAAHLYLGTHYRWGGKSPRGIDCSGLVSMAYMLCGVLIYRDAKIVDGFPIHEISRENMKPGDLILFPGHVAMYIGNGEYIHSTGRSGDDGVTINSLDPSAPNYRADLPAQITQIGSLF